MTRFAPIFFSHPPTERGGLSSVGRISHSGSFEGTQVMEIEYMRVNVLLGLKLNSDTVPNAASVCGLTKPLHSSPGVANYLLNPAAPCWQRQTALFRPWLQRNRH